MFKGKVIYINWPMNIYYFAFEHILLLPLNIFAVFCLVFLRCNIGKV